MSHDSSSSSGGGEQSDGLSSEAFQDDLRALTARPGHDGAAPENAAVLDEVSVCIAGLAGGGVWRRCGRE